MVTEQQIYDMYAHLRATNSSIPDEALEFMKSVCLENLDKTHHSYASIARPIMVDGDEVICVWTDGVSLIADNKRDCEYLLTGGKQYKVSVVEVS